MNLPNAITTARIAVMPLVAVLPFVESWEWRLSAFVLYIAAAVTDYYDGMLARTRNQVTDLGGLLDPLADKLLVGAALFVLVDERSFPLWAALVIAVREAAVQVLRIRRTTGGRTMPASAFAKAKTATQIVMVSWWLLPWGSTNAGHWISLAAALVTTVASGWEYFARSTSPAKAAA